MTRSEPLPVLSSVLAHALLAGIAVTACSVAVAVLAVPMLFAGVTGLAVLAGFPLIAAGLLLAVTRTVTGRFHTGWNIVLAVLLTVAALALLIAPLVVEVPALPTAILVALPLLLGAAGGAGSLIVHPGRARVVGAVTLVALLAVGLSPFVQTALGRTAAARVAEEAEYERRLALSVVPFTTSELTPRAVSISDYQSSVRASEDPLARQDTDGLPDPGDITILTQRFDREYALEIQVCSLYTNPEMAGTAGNTCERRDDGIWVLEVDGRPMLAELVDSSLIFVSGTDRARLESLLATVVPMGQEEYERRVRLAFERDLRA